MAQCKCWSAISDSLSFRKRDIGAKLYEHRVFTYAIFLLILMLLVAFGYTIYLLTIRAPSDNEITQTFQRSDRMSASAVCEERLRRSFQSSLVRYFQDDHSSYFDNESQLYKLYYKVDVGSVNDYSQTEVYCHVSAVEARIDYYKEISKTRSKFYQKMLDYIGS